MNTLSALRILISNSGISLAELARRINLPRNSLYNMFSKKTDINVSKTLIPIANELGYRVCLVADDDVLELTNEQKDNVQCGSDDAQFTKKR